LLEGSHVSIVLPETVSLEVISSGEYTIEVTQNIPMSISIGNFC
jgi:hypothetical protein